MCGEFCDMCGTVSQLFAVILADETYECCRTCKHKLRDAIKSQGYATLEENQYVY